MGSPQALVLGCSFRLRPRLAITDPIQSNSIESRPGRRFPHNPFLCQLCQALRSELEKKGWSSEGRF
ncbi:hypothetical protein BHM03_00039242 [Ensete ventricosum]|nr:hypothetical protein BHM03_00039242 [Ensete ventricosum]